MRERLLGPRLPLSQDAYLKLPLFTSQGWFRCDGQELYAVTLQVRICAGGNPRVPIVTAPIMPNADGPFAPLFQGQSPTPERDDA